MSTAADTPSHHPAGAPRADPAEKTPLEIAAERAAFLAQQLGTALRVRRAELRLTQTELGARVGISQRHVSVLEGGRASSASLEIWVRAAVGSGVRLAAFMEGASGASEPRDTHHLAGQNVCIATSRPGGWEGTPEYLLPGDPFPRSIDVLLTRITRKEIAVIEVWDLITDGGAAMRSLERKVATVRDRHGDEWRVQGVFIIRATRRNRDLVAKFREVFAGRFPASAMAWLEALRNPDAPMPDAPGLLWVDLDGTRLLPSRLRQGR